MKSWLYKLFGVGKIRDELLNELKPEGIIASDEGVKASITYINFRAPGRYSNWKRRWIAGAIILTEKRLVLQQYSIPVIILELTDARFQEMKFSLETEHSLLFEFEPNLFLENSSGQIEWRVQTPQAKIIAESLQSKTNNFQ